MKTASKSNRESQIQNFKTEAQNIHNTFRVHTLQRHTIDPQERIFNIEKIFVLSEKHRILFLKCTQKDSILLLTVPGRYSVGAGVIYKERNQFANHPILIIK